MFDKAVRICIVCLFLFECLNVCRNVRPETSKSYAGEEFWEDDREQRQQRRAVKRIAKAETAARQVEEKLTHVSSHLIF